MTTCDWNHCEAEGKIMVYRRGHGLGFYCDAHAEIAADEDSPEYIVDCPHCHCKFGVN